MGGRLVFLFIFYKKGSKVLDVVRADSEDGVSSRTNTLKQSVSRAKTHGQGKGSRETREFQKDDVYGTISKDSNVAPNGRMVSRDTSNDGLSLQYITARLIVLTCDEPETHKYVESLKTAAAALKSNHFEHYKVWNVSRRRGDVQRILGAEEGGWPRGLAPPLDRLCAVCKQIEQWLNLHPQNVVVIHCKGDRSRAAMVLAAHMHYNVICANDDPVEERFNMKRFADQHIGGSGQPSHRRYIHYFSSLLSGRVVVNPSPLFLLRLAVSHLNGKTLAFKVYERMSPVYESTSSHARDVVRWDVDGELKLRGDVLVKIFQYSEKGDKRRELFLCQLNTCSLELKTRTASLTFHKEELDLIFDDPTIHNDVVLELLVSFDAPKPSKRQSVSHLETRTNSYEDFQQAEDEPYSNGAAVVYSEIKKEGKETKEPATMPPPVPPKPRSHSAMGELLNDVVPERRGVLPAQVRPVAHRPPSPRTAAERATPSIEPDLVGKDRYDKASKCFSYAPKKELSEAFERPRRPSFSRNLEPTAEEQITQVDPEEAAKVAITPSQILKPVEPTMKWDDEVEKAKQDALLDQLSRMPLRSLSVAGQPYYQRRSDDVEERPLVVEQAQRAVAATTPTGTLNPSHRSTNYGSYKTLNDDRYSNAMDDLCDPNFYLNYKAPSAPVPPPRHAGAKSVELPRRRFQPLEAFTDPLDEILNTTAGSCQDLSRDNKEAFRTRNCQSVATAPSRERKLFVRNYDATEEAGDTDDWLSTQLRKVRSKRNLDPDLVRRRTQEKMLLEELKNVNEDKDERKDYVVDGYGSRPDPLAEFRREEERLRNTNSPFQDGPRRSRGVRSKPPTPPPRDRSRSPARSEVATPSIDSHTYKHINGHGGHNQENEDFDFSTLNSIVQPASSGRTSRSLNRKPSFGNDRPPFQYQDMANRPETPTKFFSGQERVAAAIFRAETPQREMYASGTVYRPETPNRYFPENTTMNQRTATPSFPRETPIPFHPLLYSQNGNSRTELDRAQTLNYRSSSPRSQYGQLSRRSSLTSVDTSEIIHHHPVFVKDTSKYWYKPNISREAAINMLRDKQPGTFVVRDSNSFPGAFGLALKVAQPPPGVAPGDGTELVRHFLIEPSPKGVKLKGCNNEPVFGSLSALVYQHSITPLALPTKLLLPEYDPASTPEHVSATQALLEQGAACNVTFIGSVDVESLTGTECVRRAIAQAAEDSHRGMCRPVSVHFKVSSQGITLTDNTRKVFFRRHFPVNNVIFAGMDPSDRRFDNYGVLGYSETCVPSARMFAFVARKPSSSENACQVFAELEPEQPASAVINFINKVMLANRRN